MPTHDRHLAAILFTDIVGYTAMMQKDEGKAVKVIKHYHEVLEKAVPAHRGEILNDYGDGSLCSFSSALDALNCAMELHRGLQTEPAVPLRIGLHVGEIFHESGKVLGDGVNVASRIQSLGTADSILLSSEINSKIKNQPEFKTVSLGNFRFKNVEDRIEVFALLGDGLGLPHKKTMEGKLEPERNAKRKWVMAVSLLLLTAAAYFIYEMQSKANEAVDKSIAVLPFVNMSNDQEQEYFSDGLTEELLNVLTKAGDLKVIARTSSFAFKGKNEDVRTIATRLNVAHVLEGSVRRSGDMVRITAQLIRATDGAHLWSETYDRKMNDVFQVQDDIAGAILRNLRSSLSLPVVSPVSISGAEVNNLLLKGNFFYEKRDRENLEKALGIYYQALAIDSLDARIWAAIAKNCIPLSFYEGNSKLEESKRAVNKALELDTSLPEAYRVLGFLKSRENDRQGAVLEYKKVIDLQPGNADVLRNLGTVMRTLGKLEESIQYAQRALELDPVKPVNHWTLSEALLFSGKYPEAIRAIEDLKELQPNYPDLNSILAETYLLQGKPEMTLSVTAKMEDQTSKSFFETLAYYSLGRNKEFEEGLANCLKTFGENSWMGLAQLYAFAGRKEEAFTYMDKAFAAKSDLLATMKVDPLLRNLRSDPRFAAMLVKMNLPVD